MNGFANGAGRKGRRRWTGVVVGAVGATVLGAAALSGITVASAAATGANLLTGDQATFDNTTGGWAGSGASVSEVSNPVMAGTGAMAVTSTAAGTVAALSGTGPGSWTPATAGRVYAAQVWTLAATAPRSVETALAFLSSSGASLGAVWGQLSPDTTTSWTQTTPAVGMAPAGTAYVKVAVLVYNAGAGETHYFDSATLTGHGSGSAAITGPLHTAGNRIYDANNNPVTLRGTVSDWLDWNPSAPAGSPLDDNNVAQMKQWGDNVVRVLLSEDYWLSTSCHYSPGYAGAVDQVVRSITSRGMVAMLDLHNNSRTNACTASSQQRMADAPGSITFWQQVANRYGSNPLVAFDLYNEPYDITWDQWRNGGTLTDGDGVTWQAAGMQQLYTTVRHTGAKNLVFVSGNGWAGNPPSGRYLLGGSNVVYAAHAYSCPNSTPAQCTYPNPTAVPSFLTAWAPLATTSPVMVTEFGWPDSGGSDYNQNIINWAEGQSIGWTAYGWYAGGSYGQSTPDFGMLASSFEPQASGMPVLAGLAPNSPNS